MGWVGERCAVAHDPCPTPLIMRATSSQSLECSISSPEFKTLLDRHIACSSMDQEADQGSREGASLGPLVQWWVGGLARCQTSVSCF